MTRSEKVNLIQSLLLLLHLRSLLPYRGEGFMLLNEACAYLYEQYEFEDPETNRGPE